MSHEDLTTVITFVLYNILKLFICRWRYNRNVFKLFFNFNMENKNTVSVFKIIKIAILVPWLFAFFVRKQFY